MSGSQRQASRPWNARAQWQTSCCRSKKQTVEPESAHEINFGRFRANSARPTGQTRVKNAGRAIAPEEIGSAAAWLSGRLLSHAERSERWPRAGLAMVWQSGHSALDEADLWAPQRPLPERCSAMSRKSCVAVACAVSSRGSSRSDRPWCIRTCSRKVAASLLHHDFLSQDIASLCCLNVSVGILPQQQAFLNEGGRRTVDGVNKAIMVAIALRKGQSRISTGQPLGLGLREGEQRSAEPTKVTWAVSRCA